MIVHAKRLSGVACRKTELVLDARNPELLARFWCEVLGYVELERVDASIKIGMPGIGFGGPQPRIVIDQPTEPKVGKLRLHVDVSATDRNQEEEVERLLAAGARLVDIGQTGDEPWQVLADPEQNELCLLRQRVPKLYPSSQRIQASRWHRGSGASCGPRLRLRRLTPAIVILC